MSWDKCEIPQLKCNSNQIHGLCKSGVTGHLPGHQTNHQTADALRLQYALLLQSSSYGFAAQGNDARICRVICY